MIRLFAVYLSTILSLTTFALSQTPDEPPVRFGHPLFNPNYTLSPLDGGDIYQLTSLERAVLNIEHSGDLLGNDIRFFHPDFVTAGRTVMLASLGSGVNGTRLLWRGRPFRDIGTGRANFDLMPLYSVGGIEAVHWGALDGVIGSGAVVQFQPLTLRYDQPVTVLYHRDGYYDFGPVEFIHSRRIGHNSYLSLGGFFPSSQGKFAHADYEGQTLHGEYVRRLGESTELTTAYMTGLHRVDIPFSDITRTTHRDDLDLQLVLSPNDRSRYEIGVYRVENRISYNGDGEYGRDVGLVVRGESGSFGGYMRINRMDGRLIGDSDYDLTQWEGSIGWRDSVGFVDLWLLAGGYGWWMDRIKPVTAGGLEAEVPVIGTIFASGKRAVDPHSPEMMFAEYRVNRPDDPERPVHDFDPTWNLYPELPVIGRTLPVTVNYGGNVGIRRNIRFGELELSGFRSVDRDIAVWSVDGDSVIIPKGLDQRTTTGWMLLWRWGKIKNSPFRAMISMVGMNRFYEGVPEKSYWMEEPNFRLNWEIGWHRSFWDDQFETDILIGGRYFDSFYAYGSNGIERIGGAYPLDIRFTGRIHRFTLFYGVHNWNAYPYYLVPGYKMMHKEEYWGIHWMMLQ